MALIPVFPGSNLARAGRSTVRTGDSSLFDADRRPAVFHRRDQRWAGERRPTEDIPGLPGGLTGIAPAIPLILMASSITYIVAQGGILDTILYSVSQPFSRISPRCGAARLSDRFADRILYFLRLGEGIPADTAACPACRPGRPDPPDDRDRLCLRRRLFQYGLSDQPGPADLPGAERGQLSQVAALVVGVMVVGGPGIVVFLLIGTAIQLGHSKPSLAARALRTHQ